MVVPLNRRHFLSWIKKAAIVAGIGTQINSTLTIANKNALPILIVQDRALINAKELLEKIDWNEKQPYPQSNSDINEYFVYKKIIRVYINESSPLKIWSNRFFNASGEVLLIESKIHCKHPKYYRPKDKTCFTVHHNIEIEATPNTIFKINDDDKMGILSTYISESKV